MTSFKLGLWRVVDKVMFRWMCLDWGKWYNRPRIRFAFWLYDPKGKAHQYLFADRA